jgi:XTP/dITP diphosphohydrolase
MLRRVVLATRNEGKLREMQSLLSASGWELSSQSAYGLPSAPETCGTFVENALAKARHVSAACGLPALADDSGLVVDALGGAPGVYSARFAGEGATDEANNARLIELLREHEDRRAHFYCAIVYLPAHDHPEPLIACGRWTGLILDVPRGTHGFGYDPLFLDDALGRTAAELDPATKNAASHRGKACRDLLRQLQS